MAFALDDQPTLWDGLGRSALLYEVGRQVTTGGTPQVIAVTGDWGSGKTSFLRQLQFLLSYEASEQEITAGIRAFSADDSFQFKAQSEVRLAEYLLLNRTPLDTSPVVWFSAWHYQHETAPIVALIHEIRRQFSPGRKLWEFIKKESQVALESSLLALEPICTAIEPLHPGAKFFGKIGEKIRGVGEKYESTNLQTELSTEQIRRLLGHAVNSVVDSIDFSKWLKTVGYTRPDGRPVRSGRLVIIVDDLDRCEPEMALKLLEGIKVYMNLDKCVFVLGINDHRLLGYVASLQKEMSVAGEDAGASCRHRAKDYLDKIINRHYGLGIKFHPEQVITGCLGKLICRELKDSGQTVNHDLTAEVHAILVERSPFPPNARKIKGLLATIQRYEIVEFKSKPDPTLLVLFAYLNQFHPRIIRMMSYYPGFALAFFEWTAAPDTTSGIDLDGLLPMPRFSDQTQSAASSSKFKFVDPIESNLFHAHELAHEWWEIEQTKAHGDSMQLPDLTAVGARLREFLAPYMLLG